MADGFRAAYGTPHVLDKQYIPYFYGYSSHAMGSPAAYNSYVTSASNALYLVDVGANVCLEAHRSAFLKGYLHLLATAFVLCIVLVYIVYIVLSRD
jgi:hypothetical protein